jgi:glycosyltransferase involved in cell wall biosynthesis
LIDTCIVIPVYNESQVISTVLDNLSFEDYLIVVVDDGSTDNSYEILRSYDIHLIKHPINLGQGAALMTGITYATNLPGIKYIVSFDSDGQHQASDIPRLIKPLIDEKCDVVLGSRFMRGANVQNISPIRRITLKLALVFTRISTGLNITDTHNGLRAFTVQAAKKINITQNRMAHASELLQQISRLNLKYLEVPVTILYTDYSMKKGQTLANGIDILLDIIRGRF